MTLRESLELSDELAFQKIIEAEAKRKAKETMKTIIESLNKD